MSESVRPDQRANDALRPLSAVPGIAPHAQGSVLIQFGKTQVICAASVESRVPRWMSAQGVPGGWLTAEYSMLPYSTLDRKDRDISRGKLDGRTVEIQRLIGRSLRAVVDLKKLPGKTIWLDCDVLQADGGTRTASITGACIAAKMAVQQLIAAGELEEDPIRQLVSAISVGIYQKQPVLDLEYVEDRDADVDFNVVMTEAGEYVEVQGTGEEATFTQEELDQLLQLAARGIQQLVSFQKDVLQDSSPSSFDVS